MYNPQSHPADSTEERQERCQDDKPDCCCWAKPHWADKKQQPREVARAEAFNVQRSTFGVQAFTGAVVRSELTVR